MNFARKTEQFCEKNSDISQKKLSLPEAWTPKSSKILVKKKPALEEHGIYIRGFFARIFKNSRLKFQNSSQFLGKTQGYFAQKLKDDVTFI